MKSKDDIGLVKFFHDFTLLATFGIGVGWIPISLMVMILFFIAWYPPFFISFLSISLLEFVVAFTYFRYRPFKSKRLPPKGRLILVITGTIGFIGSFIPIGTDGYVTFYLTLFPIEYWVRFLIGWYLWLLPISCGILDWHFYKNKMIENNEYK
ncbi:MAG: hypothetical protein HWN65_11255 [Candidatus Helarchaeota archaeon]|nr:hypothetical protein [Candidatus Helarchaeota archaeon]